MILALPVFDSVKSMKVWSPVVGSTNLYYSYIGDTGLVCERKDLLNVSNKLADEIVGIEFLIWGQYFRHISNCIIFDTWVRNGAICIKYLVNNVMLQCELGSVYTKVKGSYPAILSVNGVYQPALIVIDSGDRRNVFTLDYSAKYVSFADQWSGVKFSHVDIKDVLRRLI